MNSLTEIGFLNKDSPMVYNDYGKFYYILVRTILLRKTQTC